jgi:hypothetical protein
VTTEDLWSEELNHIIHDEEAELGLLLLFRLKCLGNDVCKEFIDKSSAERTMGFEEDAHDLSQGKLQVILVVVLFLDDLEVIFVDGVVLVLDILVLRHLVVFLDAVI